MEHPQFAKAKARHCRLQEGLLEAAQVGNGITVLVVELQWVQALVLPLLLPQQQIILLERRAPVILRHVKTLKSQSKTHLYQLFQSVAFQLFAKVTIQH